MGPRPQVQVGSKWKSRPANSSSEQTFQSGKRRRKDNQQRPGFRNKNKSSFQKALVDFKQKQENKTRLRETKQRQHEEKVAALERYKKKKQERSSVLKKKTRKGQPLMKGRMDLLLERIHRTIASDN